MRIHGSCLLLFLLAALGRAAAGDEIAEELELARKQYAEGSYYKAADLLRDLLLDVPGATEARILLLRVELARGELEEAEALAAALAELEGGGPPDALLARADLAFARGRLDEAERLAHEARAAAPDDLRSAVAVARVLEYRGRDEESRAFVDGVLGPVDLNRLDSDGLLSVSRLYRAVGEWELAAQACVHAERRRKKEERPTTDVLVELGDLYRLAHSLSGDTPRAFSTYRDALKQNGSLVAAKVGRALVHLYVNDSYDAEKEIDEALAINPNSVDALGVKAWFRVLDGRHTEALEIVDRALEVNPVAKSPLANRAAALWLLDRADEYEEVVTRILEVDPTYGEVYRVVGDALSRNLRFADAVPFHRRALDVDPGNGIARISLGRDLCFTGREEEGLEALRASYDGHPYPHPWRNNMELILEKLDREFVDSETEHFRLRVHVDENPILGPRLRTALEDDYVTLTEKYGWKPDEVVLVEMMPKHEDFSVRTVGFYGLGAVGACFGNFVTLVSPRSEARHTFCYRRTALHELAHVVTIGRSNARVPRWLTEGLSVYEERIAKPTWGRDQELELYHAYRNDELMPLREFNAYFRGPRIGFAYYQGGLFCHFVDETYGFDALLGLLDAFGDGLETPGALERVFEKSPEELDREFADWVWRTRLEGKKVQPYWSQKKRNEMRRELRKRKDDVDLLAEVAWAYYQAGKTVDSDVHLDKALKRDPTHAGALRLAARRALDRKRPDLAREHLESAFENGGEEYYAALQLAKLRVADDDLDQAYEALQIARRCFPYDVGPGNPYLGSKEIMEAEGEPVEAMKHLEEFVVRAEAAIEARIELATWLAAQERVDDAIRFLDEAEEIDPFIRDVHVRKARVLRDSGRLAEAVDSLRTALLVDPRLEPGYDPRAGAEGGTDDRAQAELLVEIAEIELDAGDAASARRDLQHAKRLWSDVPGAEELAERLAAER